MEKLLDVSEAPCYSAHSSHIHGGSHHEFTRICVGLAHVSFTCCEKDIS